MKKSLPRRSNKKRLELRLIRSREAGAIVGGARLAGFRRRRIRVPGRVQIRVRQILGARVPSRARRIMPFTFKGIGTTPGTPGLVQGN